MVFDFSTKQKKLKRTAKLVHIFTKYGFTEILEKLTGNDADAASAVDATGAGAGTAQASFYERARAVIEALGPTYVKFGQVLSTREDLFPKAFILELKKLQDSVPPIALDLPELLERELGISVDTVFDAVDAEPFASASIAQVYRATRKDGSRVILKVKRPGIREIVEADLLLLRDLVDLLMHYYAFAREVHLDQIFEAFEQNIYEELSFKNELKNITQFAQNFKNEKTITCIQPYADLSNDNVLCMSFIQGVKINDVQALLQQGINLETTLDRGLSLYLSQVFEFGFFHADPHPGNILVTPSGKIAFIDLGSVGKMLAKDRELLEDFILYFVYKNAAGLIQTIKKMALSIAVENEKTLTRDIEEMFHLIGALSLEELDIKMLFTKFSGILNRNNISMPSHVYLLVRGIVLLEGIGRELLPALNIVDKVKPYLTKIIIRRFTSFHLLGDGIISLLTLQKQLKEMPSNVLLLLEKVNAGDLKVQTENKDLLLLYKQQQQNLRIARYFYLGIALFIGACIIQNGYQPEQASTTSFLGVSVLSWLFFILSILCIGIAKLRSRKIST